MRRRLALGAAMLAVAAGLLGAAQANAQPVTVEFANALATPSEKTFTVPAGVNSVRIVARGGRGGDSRGSTNVKYGGLAHEIAATFPVAPGQVLHVNVGLNGGSWHDGTGLQGGWNGGGLGASKTGENRQGGGGGGASDVRTTSRELWLTLESRMIVAGGGGGAASQGNFNCSGPSACAGNGGWAGGFGSNGGTTSTACVAGQGGGPGTSSQGGAGGAGAGQGSETTRWGSPGRLGDGGDGFYGDYGAGGGGGGYYGGGGGGAGRVFSNPPCSAYAGGGGGGSSFVKPGATGISSPTHSAASPRVFITYDAPPPPPPPPVSNDFTFGKPKLNKRKGTAKLPVNVPGPGALRLAASKRVKGASASAARAGTVRLAVRPTRAALRKLRRLGKAPVEAAVTYTPTGGAAKTKTKKLTLRMKR